MAKIRVLFDLKKEYYFNSLYPLYLAMSKDPRYDLWIRVGSDQNRFLGIFLLSNKSRIAKSLVGRGFQVTENTRGFDAIIVGDALEKPSRYDRVPIFHLDHGVGIKTLRIRNIVKQKSIRYNVFLEGQYWYDYIKGIGYLDKADFHVTGLPKLDPFFTPGYFDDDAFKRNIGLDPVKKTVLFAPSYKPSCIEYLADRVIDLVPEYNLVVKLHPYSWGGKYAPHSQHRIYQNLTKKNESFYLVPKDDFNVYPYLSLADTIISDTSSVVNEFLAIGKHGIIYELPGSERKHSDGMPVLSIDPVEWLKGAFTHISTPDDLIEAVHQALCPTNSMKRKLEEYRNYFFTGLDGHASQRVKAKIDSIMIQL